MAASPPIRLVRKDSFYLERAKWLFRQRGFSFRDENELTKELPDLGTRPDFLIDAPAVGKVLIEVESFIQTVEGFPPPEGFSQVNMRPPIRRMSTAIRHAARQLKPYAVLGIPLLVLLDSHRDCSIPCDIESLRDAAFGEIQFRAPWDPERGRFGEFFIHHHGPSRTLTETTKTYVTAVLWNLPKIEFAYDKSEREVPMRVAGIFNHNAAVPIPAGLFTDPDDKVAGYGADGVWGQISTVKSA